MSLIKREDVHPRCDACDHQKLKKLESSPTVRELRDKIEQLNFRLTECKNENQRLKRNLQQAKKMVYKEVGAAVSLDLQDMLKHVSYYSRKQRMETVIHLKRKLQQLQEYLNQLEGTPSNSQVSEVKKSEDKKDLWIIELERRKAKETADRDIAPLVAENNELRRRISSEKTRFRELREEVNLLRAELDSQISKNEGDMRLTKSFKAIESQIQDTISERAEIRRELVGSKTRNKRLEDEISVLKGELQTLHTKAQGNNMLIDCYTKKHKQIQEAIEAEKSITQRKMDTYRSELQALQENYDSDVEILDSLRNTFIQRHQLLSELKQDFETGFLQVNLEEQKREEVATPSGQDEENGSNSSTDLDRKKTPSSDEESSEESLSTEQKAAKEKEAEMNLRREQLLFDIALYQKLLEASRIEKERLQYISHLQERQMNELATQVVETGRLVSAKDSERSKLKEKIARMQRTYSKKDNNDKPAHLKDELEDMRIKIDGQKEENEFLRNFLLSAISSRAEDFDLYKKFLLDTKSFFEDAFQDIFKSFSQKEPAAVINNVTLQNVN